MFDRLFLASLAVSAVSAAINWQIIAAELTSQPGMAEIGLGSGFIAGIVAVSFAISLLLWFLVARKASNVAKWILVVLAAISLISLPSLLAGPWDLSNFLGIAAYVLEVAALGFLFRDDARAWLGGEKQSDPAAFD
jgi:glucan phosphoethanolaminetransferase (alkaline phosphatase superfamily)